MQPSGEITRLLAELKQGRREVEAELMPLVYVELRRLAGYFLRRERPDHTLQPTALVHEAYLRLTGQSETDWRDRAHFFAVAANVMRRILIDYARGVHAQRRGGGQLKLSLDEAFVMTDERASVLVDLDEALDRLRRLDSRQCQIVEMRFFAGLTEDEVAEVLGVSSRTVRRNWIRARSWLYAALSPSSGGSRRAPGAGDTN